MGSSMAILDFLILVQAGFFICYTAAAAVAHPVRREDGKTKLEGTWSAGCDSSKKRKRTLSFYRHLVTGTDEIFADADCTVGRIAMIREATFDLEDQVDGKNDIFSYHAVLKSVKYLVLSEVAAEALNKKKVCGDSNWKTGQLRDISSCRESAMSEQVSCFTIVQIKDSTLVFGKDTKEKDCATPARRPNTLELDIKFKLVSPKH
jgi:hypothetical protein